MRAEWKRQHAKERKRESKPRLTVNSFKLLPRFLIFGHFVFVSVSFLLRTFQAFFLAFLWLSYFWYATQLDWLVFRPSLCPLHRLQLHLDSATSSASLSPFFFLLFFWLPQYGHLHHDDDDDDDGIMMLCWCGNRVTNQHVKAKCSQIGHVYLARFVATFQAGIDYQLSCALARLHSHYTVPQRNSSYFASGLTAEPCFGVGGRGIPNLQLFFLTPKQHFLLLNNYYIIFYVLLFLVSVSLSLSLHCYTLWEL